MDALGAGVPWLVLGGLALACLLLGIALFRARARLRRLSRRAAELAERCEDAEVAGALIDRSPDGIVVVDGRGAIVHVNEAYCRMTGRSKDECLGSPVSLPGWNPDDRPSIEEQLAKTIRGATTPFETTIAAGDGARIPVLFSPGEIRTRLGTRYFAIVKDISERKRAEEALRQSEARFKAQFQSLSIPVYIWRKEGEDFRLVDYNDAAVEITDGGIASVHGIRLSELFRDTPDLIEDMWICYRKRGTHQRDMIYPYRTTDKTRHLVVSYAFVPPDMILVHTQDDTERAEAEERLRESEARLRTAVDSVPFDLFMLDRDGRYVMQNAALREHWGREIMGMRPRDMGVDAKTLALWERNNARALAGEVVSGEVAFEIKGEERFFYNIVSPVHDGEEVRGVLGVNIDITDRKRAEKEVARSREELRALAGRLHDIREEESSSISREIHDELGQALAVLKWEFALVGKRLAQVGDPEERSRLKARIDALTGRIDATIETVKRISSRLRPVILDDLGLVGAIEWHAADFQERTGIRCECSRSGLDQGRLGLDRQRSTAAFRILQEVLTNVLRHAEAERVWIELRRERDEAVLQVRDDGRGMPSDPDAKRSGLGILGMRERAQVFGGRVSIESERGEGTVVRVFIPIGGQP